MMKDNRGIDFYNRVNDLKNNQYKTLLAGHYFPGMSIIIDWLTECLADKILNAITDQPAFDEYLFHASMISALNQGDAFYTNLFYEAKHIPVSVSTPLANPLRYVIRQIYNGIIDAPLFVKDIEPVIYHHLRIYIEGLLGKILAVDNRFTAVNSWFATTQRINSHTFYLNLKDHIPLADLQMFADKLVHDYKQVDIKNQAERNGIRLPDKTIITGKDWSFVDELTHYSSYIIFDELSIFKQFLLLRIGIPNWVSWLRQLSSPIMQDVAFHLVNEPDVTLDILRELVGKTATSPDKTRLLLLMALKHYAKQMLDIARNLHACMLQEGRYAEGTLEKLIVSTASAEWIQWETTGLKESLGKLVYALFRSFPMAESPYFTSVLNWIGSLDPEAWISSQIAKPMLVTIDMIQSVFLDKIATEPGSKYLVAAATKLCNTTWRRIGLLLALYMNNPKDEEFRMLLLDKIISYIDTDTFRWNGYTNLNNEIASQAAYLGRVLLNGADSEAQINGLFDRFRIWHEGWKYQRNPPKNQIQRELYVLTAGISMAYLLYEQGDIELARNASQHALALTMSQCRRSLYQQEIYSVPLQWMAGIKTRFDPIELPSFVQFILEKVDSAIVFAEVAGHLVDALEQTGIMLDTVTRDAVLSRIKEEGYMADKKHPLQRQNTVRTKQEKLISKITLFLETPAVERN